MNDNRKAFLEKQIDLFSVLIDAMEKSRMNRKEKQDLKNIRDLYQTYIGEYKTLLLNNLT